MEKISFDATTLTHVNQYKTDKWNIEKKIGEVYWRGLTTTTVLNIQISEVENNISNTSKYYYKCFECKN